MLRLDFTSIIVRWWQSLYYIDTAIVCSSLLTAHEITNIYKYIYLLSKVAQISFSDSKCTLSHMDSVFKTFMTFKTYVKYISLWLQESSMYNIQFYIRC